MHLRKSDLIEIIKNNISNSNCSHLYDNLKDDDIYFDSNAVDNCAESIADEIFEKLKHALFQFSERATDGDAVALSSEIDNYLIEH